jgi:hypothetical protein
MYRLIFSIPIYRLEERNETKVTKKKKNKRHDEALSDEPVSDYLLLLFVYHFAWSNFFFCCCFVSLFCYLHFGLFAHLTLRCWYFSRWSERENEWLSRVWTSKGLTHNVICKKSFMIVFECYHICLVTVGVEHIKSIEFTSWSFVDTWQTIVLK